MTGRDITTPAEQQENRAVKAAALEAEAFSPGSSGLWIDAWRRLRKNPEAVFGLTVIAIFILLSIFADQLAPYDLTYYNLKLENKPPAWVEVSALGTEGDPRFLFGTDRNGRDLLSWGLLGIRTSMVLGLVSAPLIGLVGMLIGALSGYIGGRTDQWVMRATDVFYAFPPIMMSVLVVLALRDTPAGRWMGGMFMLFVAFLAVGWVGSARLTRSSVLVVKRLEFVEAARSIGLTDARMLFRHILPNCLSPLIVWVTLMVPQIILTEAILAYLRINPGPAGAREGFFSTSLGGMILEGRYIIHFHPIVVLIPAICVGLLAIAFTFLGDALRDALDPSSRRFIEKK
jgi:ABC-type dipeptide/oligopeptide/nickel transport system permease subunit